MKPLLGLACAALAIMAGCGGGDDRGKGPREQTPQAPTGTGTATLLAAGDIAGCDSGGDEQTAALLATTEGPVAVLGDIAYPDGSREDFERCFDPTWGRFKARILPTPGDHEYTDSDPAAYFAYFGERAHPPDGWYSYDLEAWHVVVLNSNCDAVGGCDSDSAQGEWLQEDLRLHPAECTLAYWHSPRFSSGEVHGGSEGVAPFWDVLHEAGVDVVMNGNDHLYERFAPQDPDGQPDPAGGIRQFVVGTGGFFNYAAGPPEPNSESIGLDTYGLLRLTLRPGSYDWRFLPVEGGSFTDSGRTRCT